MLSCNDLAHLHASDYIDDQLGWRDRLAIKIHLLMCERCRRFIKQLGKVPSLLRARSTLEQVDPISDAAAMTLANRLADAYAKQKQH